MAAEKEIYLIRHLATSMNKNGVYMGRRHDLKIITPISEVFIDRLKYLRHRINLENPVLYSSPTLRCLQTLSVIKKEWNVPDKEIKIKEDLWETDFGEAAGLTVEEIETKYPEVHKSWIEDQSKTQFPNGESYQQVQNRAWTAVQEIITESDKSSSIVVCSHVDVIKMILFKILDISISNKPLMIVPNGSVSVLNWNGKNIKLSGIFS